jgi:ATP-binding cassette, subfamily B, bacterial
MSQQYFEEEEFSSQFNGRTVLRILSQVKPYWVWVAGFLITVAITAFLDATFTYLSKLLIDNGIVPGDREAVYQILIYYLILILVQAASFFSIIYLTGMLGERIRYDMRRNLFTHLQNLSLSYYSKTPVGWIMSRVTSDTERVTDLLTWGLLDATWATMSIISASYFMIIINWQLAIIVLAIIPILIWIAIEFRKRILVEFRNVRRTNSKITGAYNENITGVRVVKALGRENENTSEFSQLTGTMYKSAYRAAWLSALFLPVVQILSAFAIGLIVYYSGLMSMVGAMTIGSIQAFVGYVTFMMWPIQDMARIYAEMQNSIASGERIFSLMDAVPDVVDRKVTFDPGTISGDIEFDHVNFYYEDEKPVLTDLSFTVRSGETIALVGETGGGKTTIVNLLCRFYEPKRGSIRIGGRNYLDFPLHTIHSRIGVVLQTPHLFSGTVRENIRYGRLEATDAEIVEASRLAGAHDFILRLPKGYDEDVGEGGNLLSTGQKQLISLARAILAQPEIFIMDEATSSVDTLTEALIQKGMEHLMENRTSFVIAHRLSTIRKADRIMVIENGKIMEMGTHEELLRKGGQYYRLYTRQFRQELSDELELYKLTGAATA